MVTLSAVDKQLKQAGCPIRVWGRAEVKELCKVLLDGETIAQAVNGQYGAGFAMLVATDFRILLIDKKPKYLTLKDIRFDMITELDYANRMMDSTMMIYTPNKELRFTAFNAGRLRELFAHTQHKVMEIRNHFMMQQFQQQQQIRNTPPGMALSMAQAGYQYGNRDADGDGFSDRDRHFYQPEQEQPNDEQRKLAIAMGAAGLRSIVHNGKVIKDYMAVPFTQRWRKRPYGYSRSPIAPPQP